MSAILLHALALVATLLTGFAAFAAFAVAIVLIAIIIVLIAIIIVQWGEGIIAGAFIIGIPIALLLMCYRIGAWVLSGFRAPL